MTVSTDPPSSGGRSTKPHLLVLPAETLSAIFSYIDPSDLVSLCLVSTAVRDAAVTHLYRSLSHEFTEVKSGQPLVDRLAGVLETLVTSDFDYASYIKEIDIGATHIAEPAVSQEFHYGTSCGKFFGTLLLTILKKISTLEKFRWDIRVELSPAMYEALGKFSSLHHLHVRMQTGPSLSSSPLPVSLPIPIPVPPPPHHHNPPPVVTPAPGFQFGVPPPMMPGGGTVSFAKRHEVHKFLEPVRTFSRFPNLETLAVLEMDTLDPISDIAECISLCAGTLKTLRLSLSDNLALKARNKPPPVNSDTDSSIADEDDDWYDPIDLPPPAAPSAGPSNDPDTRRERMVQETVLSEIFGLTGDPKADRGSDPVEQLVAKALMSAREKSRAGRSGSAGESADRMFVKQLRSIAQNFQDFHGPTASGSLSRNKTWKVIESLHKATNLYLEKHENADSADASVVADSNAPGSSPVNEVDLQSHMDDIPGPSTMPPLPESISNQVTETDPANKNQNDTIADLIDLEHPDDDGEEVEDQEFIDQADTPESLPIGEGNQAGVKLSQEAVERSLNKGKAPVREIDVAGEQPAQPEDVNTVSIGDRSPSHDRQIHEYVRARHGLPLENLSIYLIPVKPSVICRAINVWSLRHVSLLNVGPQRAFWATLSKLHDSNPLQLTSIHTDNVTQAFLDFVHDLDCVKELFLFERKTRCVVKSLAPKTTVTIEDINEKILKKHTKQLERLIIRNDEDMTWSLNRDSVRQIFRHGAKIKEMVVGLKSANFHMLIQCIGRLRSLVVLHVLFSAHDHCVNVLREIRSCALDSILTQPFLKVRYVAVSHAAKEPLSTGVSRIDRKTVPTRLPRSRRYSDSGSGSALVYPVEATDANETKKLTESEDSPTSSVHEDETDLVYLTRVMVTENLKIEEVKDVRVWEKEIWHLRL